ncbi:MAG: hypothetical protein SXA11_21425 [Cyanobacteriota bacterium]|nr:hypothetical protein [Cyanobacteriota bacterium]
MALLLGPIYYKKRSLFFVGWAIEKRNPTKDYAKSDRPRKSDRFSVLSKLVKINRFNN